MFEWAILHCIRALLCFFAGAEHATNHRVVLWIVLAIIAQQHIEVFCVCFHVGMVGVAPTEVFKPTDLQSALALYETTRP